MFWHAALEERHGDHAHGSLGGAGRRTRCWSTRRTELTFEWSMLGRGRTPAPPSAIVRMTSTGVFDRIPELRIYFAETQRELDARACST